MQWRPATAAEVHAMTRTTGGTLPPGTYAVFGGTLPPELAATLCSLLASVDYALPPRAYQYPPGNSPEWAEVVRLLGDRLEGPAEDVTLIVGAGKAWAVELRLDAGGPKPGIGHGPSLVFERRRQGMLQSSPGFFAEADC